VSWPGRIPAGSVVERNRQPRRLVVTLLSVGGLCTTSTEGARGRRVNGTTYKVHLDGHHDQLA